jgi:hypothetical protein
MRVRSVMIALGVVALTVAALGVGVALGSGMSHAQSSDPPTSESTAKGTTKSAGGTNPKSQAYARFLSDGTMVGPSKKVVAVHHIDTGQYCVELAASIHVTSDTFSISMIDYFSTGDRHLTTQAYSYPDWCGVNYGFPNSVEVLTGNASTGAAANASAYFMVP